MANNLGITEVSLTNIADSTNNVNVIGAGAGSRDSAYQPLVVRVVGHDADTGAEEDDPDLMALFLSTRHGEPWCKQYNTLERVLHNGPVTGGAAPSNATLIFPDYDYTTFE